MVAQSENNGPVRPHSQDELPPVGQQSLGIESSTRFLVLCRLVKKAFYNSYSQIAVPIGGIRHLVGFPGNDLGTQCRIGCQHTVFIPIF
jgi:hypothetical protein